MSALPLWPSAEEVERLCNIAEHAGLAPYDVARLCAMARNAVSQRDALRQRDADAELPADSTARDVEHG